MTDDLVNKLRAVDHFSLEDCFCQSPLYDQAAVLIKQLTAERDRLRALLAEADCRIAWEAHGFGNDFAERVEAALKGENHE